MAQLFKKRRLENKAKEFKILHFETKIEEIKKWHKSYTEGSLQKKTESQCEQAFNQSFFEKILGYTPFPAEEYTYEPKSDTQSSGQKPDAVLAHFTNDGETPNRVGAVVEIKDVNVPLDRPQKRANSETPIQQGFRYKGQYKRCDFVITTNFYDIRLLKDNQLDYQQWTLDSLVNPKDDYLNFRTFYYLLCAENLLAKRGDSKTEALLSEIRVEQSAITKKFYAEYKDLRKDLIKNIVKNNSIHKENFYEIAVEKSQKIIDRLVFVAFCEDLDLLPENTLLTVIKHAQNSFSNVWDTMKGFFNAVDSGSIKLGIPDGYNGELFKPDLILDNLKIDDEICEKFLKIGTYDFSEDLSVNILGHIFEQSISDLEELKTIGSTEEDKKTSKRKKDGIFYTPEYIVDYIVRNSVGAYLTEKETEILEKHGVKEGINDKNYEKRLKIAYLEYQKVLHNIKVLDPACGSGAFLVNVFDFLLAENLRVGEIIGDLFSGEAYFKSILQNNIYGVDLNPESVEITKLSLWLKTAQKGKKLATLDQNIKCGNSLIDDPEVAGERAFKWEEEFKDIMASGGFDVVVGNPPYVSNRNISADQKEYFQKNYIAAFEQYDLYVLFMEISVKINKKEGRSSFILPDKFLISKYGKAILKYLQNEIRIEKYWDLTSKNVFPDASVYPIIYVFKKESTKEKQIMDLESFKKVEIEKIIDKSLPIITKIEKSEKVKLEVWRPLSTSKNLKNGEMLCVSNSEISRYHLKQKELKYSSSKYREQDLIKNKILLKKLCYNIEAGIDFVGYLPINTTYCLISPDEKVNLKYILTILNSKLLSFYSRKKYINTSLQGGYIELRVFQVKDLPIKKTSQKQEQNFIEKADLMLSLNKEFHESNFKFHKLLQHEYQLEKISRKLEKYWKLSFDEFIKELKTNALSLDKKSELLEFFEKHKEQALELKSKIDATDREIDEMVFDLYGLTEEERAIVLNS